MKRKPLYERCERAVLDLAREMASFIRRCEDPPDHSWSVEDTEHYLREAWRRGYAARRRDEKRRANG